MASEIEINQLCRLCLVKEQVNVPIFEEEGDLGQIFLKISACLPVKISRDDSLPKKICDSCSCKLDVVYQFWNTSANSEKQLLKWLNQLGVVNTMTSANKKNSDSQMAHSINAETVINLKQEVVELAEQEDDDNMTTEEMEDSNDSENYMLQQQHIPYENFSFQDGFPNEEPSHTVASSTVTSKTVNTRPKRKRRATTKALQSQLDSEDEDDSLLRGKITKTEEQSDSGEDPEPTAFVGLPSTSTDDQPGPSGINKGNSEAPSSDRLRSKMLSRSRLKKFRHLSKSKVTNSRLTCKVCDKVFPSVASIYQHKIVHKEKVFECEHCDKKFKSKHEVKIHYQTYHSRERNFACPICEKIFNKKQTLKYHQARHAQDYKIKCDECEKGFYRMQDFKRHYDTRHKGVRFVCDRCRKSFIDEHCFKRHLKTHNSDFVTMEFKCQVCEKIYKSKGGLNVHMKSHQNLAYVCDICGKSVTSKTSLTHHIMTHTGEKPFECEICGKCFNKKRLLGVHARIHTKEKPYKCLQCNKCFSQRSTLTVHMRYHSGERPFTCNICQKRFVTRTLLKSHSKTHGTALVNV